MRTLPDIIHYPIPFPSPKHSYKMPNCHPKHHLNLKSPESFCSGKMFSFTKKVLILQNETPTLATCTGAHTHTHMNAGPPVHLWTADLFFKPLRPCHVHPFYNQPLDFGPSGIFCRCLSGSRSHSESCPHSSQPRWCATGASIMCRGSYWLPADWS